VGLSRVTQPYALLIAAIGLIFLGGDSFLASLGGTPYYMIAGVVLIAAAVQLWRGRASGSRLYAIMLLGTLLWSLWEVGLDRWGLLPRVLAPALLGVWLLLPWARRQLSGPRNWMLPASMVIAALVVTSAWWVGAEDRTSKASSAVAALESEGPTDDWPVFAGTAGALRYSGLKQITPNNVHALEIAWAFEMPDTSALRKTGTVTVTPIKIADSLYLCNEKNVIYALDAEDGKLRWRFDPHVDMTGISPSHTCRGVAYHRTSTTSDACAERIVTNTVDARLIAVDARTGRLCSSFGDNGTVDLKRGMGNATGYYVSAAPTIAKGIIVLGGVVSSNGSTSEPSGVVRAFDATSGKFIWAWDLGRPNQRQEPGEAQSYTRATPNAWGPMAVDEELGLIYVPTGNPTPDYWAARAARRWRISRIQSSR
jgi:quinoprotein glucose dehydrogenase